MYLKRTKQATSTSNLAWHYQEPRINNGRQTIDDMSLILGLYKNYEVTKTGYLIGLVEVSGINLDLLNDKEQAAVFEDYGAFLMSTLGEGTNDSFQFIELTIPVNMTAYLNDLKRRYLALSKTDDKKLFKKRLLASYLDHFISLQNARTMTTKQHLLIVKVQIKDKSSKSLDLAATYLDEKISQVKRDLENSLTDFELTVQNLASQDIQKVLKNLVNFNG